MAVAAAAACKRSVIMRFSQDYKDLFACAGSGDVSVECTRV